MSINYSRGQQSREWIQGEDLCQSKIMIPHTWQGMSVRTLHGTQRNTTTSPSPDARSERGCISLSDEQNFVNQCAGRSCPRCENTSGEVDLGTGLCTHTWQTLLPCGLAPALVETFSTDALLWHTGGCDRLVGAVSGSVVMTLVLLLHKIYNLPEIMFIPAPLSFCRFTINKQPPLYSTPLWST